ncbi:3217_t:CDS:2 [Ambispora leptoticha]|uniref:3217_t:CDS:1 n=1 Tax=Ambispora leptoticha TaxID=144679 RepID=A0A9N9ACW5_9GLOM|nr:3217_t:CDS:2 [Ambispora leptoticha]
MTIEFEHPISLWNKEIVPNAKTWLKEGCPKLLTAENDEDTSYNTCKFQNFVTPDKKIRSNETPDI